jgi:hypothetical protein
MSTTFKQENDEVTFQLFVSPPVEEPHNPYPEFNKDHGRIIYLDNHHAEKPSRAYSSSYSSSTCYQSAWNPHSRTVERATKERQREGKQRDRQERKCGRTKAYCRLGVAATVMVLSKVKKCLTITWPNPHYSQAKIKGMPRNRGGGGEDRGLWGVGMSPVTHDRSGGEKPSRAYRVLH